MTSSKESETGQPHAKCISPELLGALEQVRRACANGTALREACDQFRVDFVSFQRWCLTYGAQSWYNDLNWPLLIAQIRDHPTKLPGPYAMDQVFNALDSEHPIVVFDTEFTSWPGANENGWSSPRQYRELVQIGAIKFNLRPTFHEVDRLDLIVRPVINPELSPYFTNLTRISNNEVQAKGLSTQSAIEEFSAFCADSPLILSNGGDGSVFRETFEIQKLKDLFNAFGDTNRLQDVNPHFRMSFALSRSTSMTERLTQFIEADTTKCHDALNDARTIAMALYRSLQEGPAYP